MGLAEKTSPRQATPESPDRAGQAEGSLEDMSSHGSKGSPSCHTTVGPSKPNEAAIAESLASSSTTSSIPPLSRNVPTRQSSRLADPASGDPNSRQTRASHG